MKLLNIGSVYESLANKRIPSTEEDTTPYYTI